MMNKNHFENYKLYHQALIKVLLVENNEVNQKVMVKFFERFNIDYEIAIDGKDAIVKAKAITFDIIFISLQLPIIDGFEATVEIRRNNDEVIIVGTSSYASGDVMKKSIKAGMNDVLNKPIDIDNLLWYFRNDNLVERYAKFLSNRINFSIQDSHELVNAFISQCKQGFNTILELYMEDNYNEILALLHQMKGAAGTIRAIEIKNRLEEVEDFFESQNYIEGRNALDEVMHHPLFAMS